MTVYSYIMPAFTLFTLICGAIKRVDLYEGFSEGVKQTINLLAGIFPYIATVLVMTELIEVSGAGKSINKFLSPLFSFLGIPEELTRLVLLKPFSGSGSLALLSETFGKYGADSYISHCAACIYGSSETTFYVSAVYFSACKNKKTGLAIIVSLISTFLSAILSCFLCRIM